MTYRIRKELADIVAPEPVDRVDIVKQLVGDLQPQLNATLPRDHEKAERTRQRIGRLHLVERMTPCDEVIEGATYPPIDPGDECPCFDCRRVN